MSTIATVEFIDEDGSVWQQDLPEDCLRQEMTFKYRVYGLLDVTITAGSTHAVYGEIEAI